MKHLFTGLGLFIATGVFAQPAPTPQWRPHYHFTPEKNWTNDPNGLIWLNGEYLAYNQQNPFENKWGHMSWGHAVSKDLLHWQHLPVAIPERIDAATHDTLWIFSGSAVWDEHNTSGFCKNGGCLVAIYTGHQPNLHKESQWIAYSNDGGRSFTNYDKDPVIDLHKRDFRDPNVFWYKPGGHWVMTVALPAEHKVRFYSSPNLRDWTLLSEFGPQGYTGAGWECPSLMELPAEGGGSKWVLMNSAAGGVHGVYMQYFVGSFDGKTFTADGDALPVDDGDCFYAAIPYNNTPGPGKILVGWMIPPHSPKTEPWTGQFSIPRDLRLKRSGSAYRLVQEPASVVRKALPAATVLKSVSLGAVPVTIDAASHSDNAYWLDAELSPGSATVAGFKIGGSTAVVGYDTRKKEVFVDRPGSARRAVAVAASSGTVRLQVLVDRSSLEVFAGDGEHVITTYIFPTTSECKAFADGGTAIISSMKIWNLSKL